jgi:hypothetical protein
MVNMIFTTNMFPLTLEGYFLFKFINYIQSIKYFCWQSYLPRYMFKVGRLTVNLGVKKKYEVVEGEYVQVD